MVACLVASLQSKKWAKIAISEPIWLKLGIDVPNFCEIGSEMAILAHLTKLTESVND